MQSRNHVLQELCAEEQVQNMMNGEDEDSVESVYDESKKSPIKNDSHNATSIDFVTDSLDGVNQ